MRRMHSVIVSLEHDEPIRRDALQHRSRPARPARRPAARGDRIRHRLRPAAGRALRLPPVRAMASQLGIAPMTVSQVYKELKDAGLLETKPGHGTFVSASVRGRRCGPQHPRVCSAASTSCSTRPRQPGLSRRRAGRPGQCADQPAAALPRPRPAAHLRRPVRGGDPAYGADIQARSAGRRSDPDHDLGGDRRQRPRPPARSSMPTSSSPWPTARRRSPRSLGPKQPRARHQLHPVGAHPHPAGADRSAGARWASSPPSRSSCRS